MSISVFTPSNNSKYMNQCYGALIDQTIQDWEWIVVLNGGANSRWQPPVPDSRVKVLRSSKRGIGALKRDAVSHCTGDILVELDHDDILVPHALERIVEEFNAGAEFVYSNTAQINADSSPNYDRFNEQMGWEYKELNSGMLECKAMPSYPSAVGYIWFAPNHVRAFSRSLYDLVGGYDDTLDVLDDQDLMCRMFTHSEFVHIDECLYLQRMHGDNTQSKSRVNQLIQTRTVDLYNKYIQPCAMAWANRNDLTVLDLGSAHNKPKGYVGLDIYDEPGVDIVADITMGIPCEDSSVGVVRAVDFLEHIPDKIDVFNEIYRVLAHGGMLLSLTPSTDGRGAFQDPTHVSFYNENSFWYFTDEEYSKYVPEIECKFQVSCLKTVFLSEWHKSNNISHVQANLVAIKDGPRLPGVLNY